MVVAVVLKFCCNFYYLIHGAGLSSNPPIIKISLRYATKQSLNSEANCKRFLATLCIGLRTKGDA